MSIGPTLYTDDNLFIITLLPIRQYTLIIGQTSKAEELFIECSP